MFRYILVNLRSKPDAVACAYCKTPLGKSYVRDLETMVLYHSPWCMECHTIESVRCIEYAAQTVS